MTKPEGFLFPFGKSKHLDTMRPMTTLKTVRKNIKAKAGIEGRWRDTRPTLVTELAESGAGDQAIMDIAGHVSRQMLSRYSHIRMEAKRKAFEGIVSKLVPAVQVPQPLEGRLPATQTVASGNQADTQREAYILTTILSDSGLSGGGSSSIVCLTILAWTTTPSISCNSLTDASYGPSLRMGNTASWLTRPIMNCARPPKVMPPRTWG